VAQLAGVNRGTAYQHFQTREQLLEATAEWVSDKLYRAVFGDPERADDDAGADVDSRQIESINARLVSFAMDNPELSRIWLFEVLSSSRPSSDSFWQKYASSFERFAKTSLAQPGIDTEVLSVLILAGTFLWPVWARSHARSAKEREQMAERYAREVLRLSLHGTLRPEKYPELAARLQGVSGRVPESSRRARVASRKAR
jgi:AcrR family transcriptional regulator